MFECSLFKAILLIGCAIKCTGIIQELQIFSELDGTGEVLTFHSKEANLDDQREFLNSAQSYCLIGWWYFYTEKNFEEWVYTSSATYERICANRTFEDINSLRYVGPLETSMPYISVYNRTSNGAHGGRELVFNETRINSFGFQPSGVLLTGFSNWELFYNNDWTGNSSCYLGTEEMIYYPLDDIKFMSAANVVGC